MTFTLTYKTTVACIKQNGWRWGLQVHKPPLRHNHTWQSWSALMLPRVYHPLEVNQVGWVSASPRSERVNHPHSPGRKQDKQLLGVKGEEKAAGKNCVHPSLPDRAVCLLFTFTFYFQAAHIDRPLGSSAASQKSIFFELAFWQGSF